MRHACSTHYALLGVSKRLLEHATALERDLAIAASHHPGKIQEREARVAVQNITHLIGLTNKLLEEHGNG